MYSEKTSSSPVFAIGKSRGGKYYQLHHGGDKGGAVAYKAVVHNWKRGAPMIEMHRGSEASDPMVAFAVGTCSGHTSQLALGDAKQRDTDPSITYDGFRTGQAYSFTDYYFETDQLNEQRQHRQYGWIRTSHHPGRYECRDLQTGEVLSVYCSRGFFKWTNIGTIEVTAAQPNARMVEYLLLVFLTWSEMENREAATIAAIS